ncbi:WD40 repeat-like protein [Mollisia scopiformis]|uniref:WD40 repeat-like protein n=1 Tax=Mollisia scopiformis TaxID=149040 RepID=A0A194X4L9_MOLSC|nr:WD40 repeat-like protein [Mollisia scopiformis]KUJ14767.1 WD40 repeat-like protein [Mollisia scopiformis]
MATDGFSSLASTVVSSQGGVVTCMKATAKNVFLGLDNGTVSILDADGRSEKNLKAGQKGVWCLDVWEDETVEEWIVVGGVDLLGVWSLRSLWVPFFSILAGHSNCAPVMWERGLDASAMGVASPDYEEKKADLVGHTSTVRCVKTLSSTTLISSSRDSTLRVWDIETATCTAVLEGHSLCVRSLAVCGDIVASVSYDHDGRVWNLQSNKCTHVLKGHESQVYAVDFDGKVIVTGGLDHTARVWYPDSGSCLAVLRVDAGLVSHLQLLPNVILGGDNTGTMHMWSLEDYSKVHTVKAHDNSVTSMRCTGSNIVTGGSDGKVKLWNLSTGTLLQELATSEAVWKVTITNQHTIAVFSRSNEVVLEIWAAVASTTE